MTERRPHTAGIFCRKIRSFSKRLYFSQPRPILGEVRAEQTDVARARNKKWDGGHTISQ